MKFHFRVVFLLATSFFTTGLALVAQDGSGSINGLVIDASTDAPIPGAIVQVIGADRGSATNEQGRFEIAGLEPGPYRLEVSSLGYETELVTDLMVTGARPTQVTIRLQEVDVETEGVTVRPDYFSDRDRTITSVRSLGNEEIRRVPGGFEDVVRAISTLPADSRM